MEEGERLSKKQLAQENTIKKLRAQLEELRSEKGTTAGTLAAEQAKVSTPVPFHPLVHSPPHALLWTISPLCNHPLGSRTLCICVEIVVSLQVIKKWVT